MTVSTRRTYRAFALSLVALVCAGVVSNASPSHAASFPTYAVTDLGVIASGTTVAQAAGNVQAMGLNNNGDVVGYENVGTSQNAFLDVNTSEPPSGRSCYGRAANSFTSRPPPSTSPCTRSRSMAAIRY